jgi:hypothetical protein
MPRIRVRNVSKEYRLAASVFAPQELLREQEAGQLKPTTQENDLLRVEKQYQML